MLKASALFLFFLSLNSFAYATSPYWVGLGSITHNYKRVQTDTAGSETLSFSFTPTLLFGANIPLPYFTDTFFTPGIGYAKFSNGGSDGQTKNEIILQYHLNYAYSSWFNFHYGFSNYITRIGGNGGTKTLNNGGSTSTFYLPSKTVSSYTASIDIAAEFIFLSEWSLRTQISVERFISKDRRSVAHLITTNYLF